MKMENQLTHGTSEFGDFLLTLRKLGIIKEDLILRSPSNDAWGIGIGIDGQTGTVYTKIIGQK